MFPELFSLALILMKFGSSDSFLTQRQRVLVNGSLRCNNETVTDGLIRLFEQDWPDPDDLLAVVKIPPDGGIWLDVTEAEVFDITPYLEIVHKCGMQKEKENKCIFVTTIKINMRSVFGYLDLSKIDLATTYKDELGKTEKCY